jgi:16S rRNA (guanine527-N7)-methyltransferase
LVPTSERLNLKTGKLKPETIRVQPDRIAELLAPFLDSPPGPPASLSDAQLGQVSAYLDLLLRWNARINLTAVRDAQNIVTRHFGESFFAARRLLPADATLRAIDLGSGAGFPGLPLKIFAPAPALALTLIESSHKKAAFLKEAVRTLSLTGVNVFAGRAEDFLSPADLLTLRAVEKYERVLESAVRLVAPGGRLALLVGAAQAARTPQLLPAFFWQAPIAVPQSAARVLLVGTNPAGYIGLKERP